MKKLFLKTKPPQASAEWIKLLVGSGKTCRKLFETDLFSITNYECVQWKGTLYGKFTTSFVRYFDGTTFWLLQNYKCTKPNNGTFQKSYTQVKFTFHPLWTWIFNSTCSTFHNVIYGSGNVSKYKSAAFHLNRKLQFQVCPEPVLNLKFQEEIRSASDNLKDWCKMCAQNQVSWSFSVRSCSVFGSSENKISGSGHNRVKPEIKSQVKVIFRLNNFTFR